MTAKKLFNWTQITALLGGPLLFVLALLLLPDTLFGFPARATVGTVFWMGFWWVRMPVSPAITALLPIAINAIFNLVPMNTVTSQYFSDIVVLLLGANMVSVSWEQTGLDKRLALKALCLIGPSLTRQIMVWFLAAVILSTVLPNAVVCAVLCPIAVSMIHHLRGNASVWNEEITFIILSCIAWGSGIGGLGTPLGGAMNLVAISYLEQLSGHEFLYFDWVLILLPVFCVILLVDLAYLLARRQKNITLSGTKAFFAERYASLPHMSRDEIVGLVLFLLPMVLAFLRSLYAEWFPALRPAYLFLLSGLLTFVLPRKDGSPISTWEQAEPRMEWGLLFLFAGGLAIGSMLNGTGATTACARFVEGLHLDGGIGTIFLFVTVTVLLAEIASNTAAAAIAVPLVIGIVKALGLNPVPYIFTTAAAFNVGYMLPTSVRAIPVAQGLSPAYLFRHGAWLSFLNILAITGCGWLLVRLWPSLGM